MKTAVSCEPYLIRMSRGEENRKFTALKVFRLNQYSLLLNIG